MFLFLLNSNFLLRYRGIKRNFKITSFGTHCPVHTKMIILPKLMPQNSIDIFHIWGYGLFNSINFIKVCLMSLWALRHPGCVVHSGVRIAPVPVAEQELDDHESFTTHFVRNTFYGYLSLSLSCYQQCFQIVLLLLQSLRF